MKRKHLAILALMIGSSAALGVSLIAGAMPLGLRSEPKAASHPKVDERQIAQREAVLARAERQLERMATRRPPQLPEVPDRIRPARGGGGYSGAITQASRPAPQYVAPARSSTPPPVATEVPGSGYEAEHEYDDDGEHEFEHEEDNGEHEDD